eukprot:CAMPEP_0114344812 /NCGR_PEP_ID=MMETSP0101-20121206/11711_1 /TAXON_ID=38822 ORGANISM="Pteridomonas danica, Strain PT" /NCGR_SAMPLE_ID=MMETSP0101 /ASSEMBLY_ACC=CAM_ASM_000211 /LENGTH=57 /DNA_ID=CAMNT_0001480369 /DNA_START=274 /DNA_END=447 /DNA_ORIENTATION=-
MKKKKMMKMMVSIPTMVIFCSRLFAELLGFLPDWSVLLSLLKKPSYQLKKTKLKKTW